MNHVEYLNNSIWCTLRPSKTHGVGVFAIRNIPKGTKLTDYTFTSASFVSFPKTFSLNEAEFSLLLPEIQSIILDRIIFSSDYNRRKFIFISPNRHAVLQLFMNHSTTPNSDGIHAIKDIECGEEIYEDFSKVVKKLHEKSSEHFFFLEKSSS